MLDVASDAPERVDSVEGGELAGEISEGVIDDASVLAVALVTVPETGPGDSVAEVDAASAIATVVVGGRVDAVTAVRLVSGRE